MIMTLLSKIVSFSPFCLLCPDSSQRDSAPAIVFLEVSEKDSWVLEDGSKYTEELVYLSILNVE